jgi:RNA polymerase sigma-70 factor (ECF subfamily)
LRQIISMEQIDEKNLIKRILDGDVQAFSIIVRRYQQQIYSLIVQIVSCREEAEELTQDVFLKVYKKLSSFKRSSSLSTWIYRIAWNSAISYTRKKKKYYPVNDEKFFAGIPDDSVDELLNKENDEELLRRLDEAVGKLNPEERLLLSLFYFEKKSTRAMAEITGLTIDNVKIKLYRIRKKIVALIDEYKNEAG